MLSMNLNPANFDSWFLFLNKLIQHWSNLFFFEDLNLIVKDNFVLFYLVLKEENNLFNYLLKIRMLNAIINNVIFKRSSVLLFLFSEYLIKLEFYKKYCII